MKAAVAVVCAMLVASLSCVSAYGNGQFRGGLGGLGGPGGLGGLGASPFQESPYLSRNFLGGGVFGPSAALISSAPLLPALSPFLPAAPLFSAPIYGPPLAAAPLIAAPPPIAYGPPLALPAAPLIAAPPPAFLPSAPLIAPPPVFGGGFGGGGFGGGNSLALLSLLARGDDRRRR